jgi:hypothetical protein
LLLIRHVGGLLPEHVHDVLGHTRAKLPFQLLEMAGDCLERTYFLVQQVLLLAEP